jgi:polyisoprenoid-binding protein YceI
MTKSPVIIIAMLLCAAPSFAQLFFANDGKIKFDATAPASPDKIEGTTNSATCLLDLATGDLAWQVLVKGFKFEKALMQEHFNENYLESDKYPKATFSGKITNMAELNLKKDGTYKANVTGKMKIHGVEKEHTAQGTVTVGGGKITLNSEFDIKLADYDIKIPMVVSANIAKTAKVSVSATLSPKK